MSGLDAIIEDGERASLKALLKEDLPELPFQVSFTAIKGIIEGHFWERNILTEAFFLVIIPMKLIDISHHCLAVIQRKLALKNLTSGQEIVMTAKRQSSEKVFGRDDHREGRTC